MKERKLKSENRIHQDWLEKTKKGGITDINSPNLDNDQAVDLLNEILCATDEDVSALIELAKGEHYTNIFRKNAIRTLTNLSEKNRWNNTIDLIDLYQEISNNKEDEDDVRVMAYEDYRYLKIRVFGGLSKEELIRERELSEKETSLRMKWLRYMRD